MTSDKATSSTKAFFWVTAGRLALFVILLLAVLLLQSLSHTTGMNVQQLSLLLGAAFMLTGLYLLWYRFKGLSKGLLVVSTINDAILAAAAVHLTGGPESPCVFLFLIAIITAALTGGQQIGTLSAFLNTAIYAGLFWYTIGGDSSLPRNVFRFSVNMAAFNITALLTIILGRRLWAAEQHLSEMAVNLRRLEEIQRNLIDSMKSGLVTVDDQGRILDFNAAATEILGPVLEGTRGRPIAEAWPKGAEMLRNCISYEPGARKEVEIDAPSGPRFLGVSCFPIHDRKGQFLGYGIIFQDITEAKEQARRLQTIDRLAALGEMAAGLAHEIRNPLASIRGAAEFLAQGGASGQQARLLEIIVKETQRLEGLTRSFLLYGRPESKKIEALDLSELASGVVELLQRRKGFSTTSITLDIHEGLQARADAQLMKQVLLNLLINAWQALPEEGGEIVIRGRRRGSMAELRVIDNGHGIKEEDLDQIFNPFFTTKPEGTGLGLSIVHRIVTQFGGELTVDSAPGEGTVFTILLPLAIEEQRDASEMDEEGEDAAAA